MRPTITSQSFVDWYTRWSNPNSPTNASGQATVLAELQNRCAVGINRMMSDSQLRSRLGRHFDRLANSGSLQIAESKLSRLFLTVVPACDSKQPNQYHRPPGTLGEKRSELLEAASAARDLAKKIDDLFPLIRRGASLSYLTDRTEAGSPRHYIHNRKKLGSRYIKPKNEISALLNTLSDDLGEEADRISRRIESSRQNGGRLADFHAAMDSVTCAVALLSTPPDFELAADILTVLLATPDVAFGADTLRRRFEVLQGMLRLAAN